MFFLKRLALCGKKVYTLVNGRKKRRFFVSGRKMNLFFMEEKMKTLVKRTAVAGLAAVMAAGMLSGCGQKTLDGTKTVATVNGTEVPLGVVSLLARQQQAQTEYMYASFMGGQEFNIWDTAVSGEEGETYGEQLVHDALEQVELMYLMKEKAADYGVEITEEDRTAMAEAAAAFMEANSEETIRDLGVSEDQVKTLLELQTYMQRIYDPIAADVDTEVSDEESQQSSFTYITVPVAATADEGDDAEAADAENDADAETSDEEKDTDAEASDEEETAAAPQEQAQEILDKLKEDPDADMQELADEVGDGFTSLSGTFDTFERADEEESASSYPDEVVAVLRELNDGEVAEELVEANDNYYVLRLDEKVDEDATESKKESIINTRKSDLYTETTEKWLEEAEIKVEDKVLATLKVTDAHSFTIQIQQEETVIDDDMEGADVIDEEPSDGVEVIDEEPSGTDEVIEEPSGDETVDETMEDPDKE